MNGESMSVEKGSLSRWSICGLIALLLGSTTINYIDRQVLSVLAPLLRQEFSLTNEQYAGILNAFLVTYGVGVPVAGWVIDRIGVGRTLTLAVGWWSVVGMATSLVRGPLSLGLCRSLLAVGESGAWPSFAKAVSIWVPAQWRTLAIGVCNSGSSLGAMIAPPLVVWLTLRHGWRGAFAITGALGLLWLLAFQLFRRRHPAMSEADRGAGDSPLGAVGWRSLLRRREMWIVFVCRLLADPLWYFYVFWIPEFLARERGLNLASIGAVAWIPFLVADVANFAAGMLARRLEAAGWSVNRTRKALMIIGAGVSPIGVAAVKAPSLSLTLGYICVAIFFWIIWSVTVQTLPGDYFPVEVVGSVYGFGGLGSTLGSVISVWLVGQTLDLTQSYTPVFVGLGMLMPVSCIVGLALMGRVRRVEIGLPAGERPAE